MGTLTIRNLDDRVIEKLKAQAKANHRSLEGEIRHALTQRADPPGHIAEFRDRTRQLQSLTAEINHPVYDCLYLACAEISGTPLVTADKHLAASADESQLGLEVRRIGTSATARWIKDAIAASG